MQEFEITASNFIWPASGRLVHAHIKPEGDTFKVVVMTCSIDLVSRSECQHKWSICSTCVDVWLESNIIYVPADDPVLPVNHLNTSNQSVHFCISCQSNCSGPDICTCCAPSRRGA